MLGLVWVRRWMGYSTAVGQACLVMRLFGPGFGGLAGLINHLETELHFSVQFWS